MSWNKKDVHMSDEKDVTPTGCLVDCGSVTPCAECSSGESIVAATLKSINHAINEKREATTRALELLQKMQNFSFKGALGKSTG